jgi:hypothetical protein
VLARGGHLVGYRHLGPGTGIEDELARRVTLSTDEEVIGVYENPPETGSPTILVTTYGLRLVTGTSDQVIPYANIKSVSGPSTKDAPRPAITIGLVGGEAVELDVLGRKGRALDVFEVLRFLARVVEDASKEPHAGHSGERA